MRFGGQVYLTIHTAQNRANAVLLVIAVYKAREIRISLICSVNVVLPVWRAPYMITTLRLSSAFTKLFVRHRGYFLSMITYLS